MAKDASRRQPFRPLPAPVLPEEERLFRRIEEVLAECVQQAEREVNELELKGADPDEELCARIYGYSSRGPITWGMRLGRRKHFHARLCAQEKLQPLIPGRFLLEPRFRRNEAGEWELISREELQRMIREKLWKELEGTIEPDVVIISKDGIRFPQRTFNTQAVYDFKFPCPPGNTARWRVYETDHSLEGFTQDGLYRRAFQVERLRLVSPRGGVR